jgi:ubiquinone/menaquinone biosynthesis C-methylase UbiE
MLLNRVDKWAVNHPLRAVIQRHIGARRLLAMGGPVPGGLALEIGCGRGVGMEIILDLFQAGRVDAFDLDPQMVALAGKRHATRPARVHLWTGDVTAIPNDDGVYDAVFDFGVIHHVPNWRDAVCEVYRVLKPGGRFYVEEALDRFILNSWVRRLTIHPLEDRFNHDQFRDALAAAGFHVIATNQLWRWRAWFIADKPGRDSRLNPAAPD